MAHCLEIFARRNNFSIKMDIDLLGQKFNIHTIWFLYIQSGCYMIKHNHSEEVKGSDWIRLVFAHPFPLNSRAPIASGNFISDGKVQVSPYTLIMDLAQLMGLRYLKPTGVKGSGWIRLVFAHPFTLNSVAPISSSWQLFDTCLTGI